MIEINSFGRHFPAPFVKTMESNILKCIRNLSAGGVYDILTFGANITHVCRFLRVVPPEGGIRGKMTRTEENNQRRKQKWQSFQ